ncbi:MAG TPA: hypothetical protein VFR84_10100 [Candidatus Angelobacter sp.]|nr:hypothetical protein [Candidatus Angelobacter sp.]
MTRWSLAARSLPILLISLAGCSFLFYRHHDAACRQREAAYNAKAQSLERAAQEKLKIGTRKEDVEHFFAEHGLPLTFTPHEASGTIYTTGCAPSGCGSDAAILGVRVEVDNTGTVVGKPAVGGIYTNCL